MGWRETVVVDDWTGLSGSGIFLTFSFLSLLFSFNHLHGFIFSCMAWHGVVALNE